MSAYTQIIYQIVFGTKYRLHTLSKSHRQELFRYMSGILAARNCHVYCINGVEDHVHIVTHLHPSVALASLVKDIKLASSKYIKENRLFPEFTGWQEGYAAFTYTIKEKERLIKYVKNQEQHHRSKTFIKEYMEMLKEHEVEYDERYLP